MQSPYFVLSHSHKTCFRSFYDDTPFGLGSLWTPLCTRSSPSILDNSKAPLENASSPYKGPHSSAPIYSDLFLIKDIFSSIQDLLYGILEVDYTMSYSANRTCHLAIQLDR